MADENSFWREHVKRKLEDYVWMKRIHRATDGGIPDVTFTFKPPAFQLLGQAWTPSTAGQPDPATICGWIELKYCRKIDKKLPIKIEQLLFLSDERRFGRRVTIWVQDSYDPGFRFIRVDHGYDWVLAMQRPDWRSHPTVTYSPQFTTMAALARLSALPVSWDPDVVAAALRAPATL